MNTHIMHYMLCCAIVRRVNVWGIDVIFVSLILLLATQQLLTFQILIQKSNTKLKPRAVLTF